MHSLILARAYLEGVHPALPWALLTLAIFGAVYLTRKFLPSFWVWFDAVTDDLGPQVFQGLPSVLVGALMSVFLSGGDYGAAWKGALAGALAPVLHVVMKKLPIPYQGAVKTIATKAGIALLALFVAGCSPSQLQTAIKVADDVEQIAKVLCLAEHAKAAHVRASLVTDACSTVEQLAPYLDQARGQAPKAACP